MFFIIVYLITYLPCLLGQEHKKLVLNGNSYIMIEDILYPEDKFKDRGILENEKFWVNGSVPTVLWAIQGDRIEFEEVFDTTLGYLEAMTCFKFVKVAPDDPRHKLLYVDGGPGTCGSAVGNTTEINQGIAIGGGCENVGLITHETLHALGFVHTQARPDRDDYLKVLPQNAGGVPTKFNLNNNGSMYDYTSCLHYLNYFFSTGEGPTFVTRDPSHERYISISEVITYSESYQLAQYYDCFDTMGLNCPNRTCLNGGFILNNCQCFCPRNFTGPQCETFAGPWFKPGDADRKMDEPGVILTREYPFENPKVSGLTWVRLPKCFYPRMLVMTNDLLENWWDHHAVRIEDYRYNYESLLNIPYGTIKNGSGQDFVFSQDTHHVQPGRGIQVAVDFIPDGNCTDFYTDFSMIVCMKQVFANGSWKYETPNYPNPTSHGMACKLFVPTDEKSLATFNVEFDYKLEGGEKLKITYGLNEEQTLIGPVHASLKFSSGDGISLMYKASVTGNTGFFRYKATPERVPKICNTVISVTNSFKVTQPYDERYPACSYPGGSMCNMLFQSSSNKALRISFEQVNLSTLEVIVVYENPNDRTKDYTVVTGPRDPITLSGSKMLVTYHLKQEAEFSPFEITVSEV